MRLLPETHFPDAMQSDATLLTNRGTVHTYLTGCDATQHAPRLTPLLLFLIYCTYVGNSTEIAAIK